MGPEDLIRTCLDEMRDSDGIAGAGEVAEAYRSALLGTEGVAAVLGGYRQHGAVPRSRLRDVRRIPDEPSEAL